jgi:hypothetical protein
MVIPPEWAAISAILNPCYNSEVRNVNTFKGVYAPERIDRKAEKE